MATVDQISKYTPDELSILKKPCAVAVKELGCDRPDLIIYAAKLLELRKRPLQGSTLLLEVDRLQDLVKRGHHLPPLVAPPPIVYSDSDMSDSDSDSDSDCKYFSSPDPHEPEEISIRNNVSKDLETDCPQPKLTHKSAELDEMRMADLRPKVGESDIPQEPSANKTLKRDDILDQKQRLQVLRLENKKLKERQLCQKCRTQTASITFLPCGHYAYCYECGQGFSSCPICCKTILADVKTFLA